MTKKFINFGLFLLILTSPISVNAGYEPVSLFKKISSTVVGLINSTWKLAVSEICDENGNNCFDMSGGFGGKENTITVAKSGGTYTTIQGAIDASTSADKIIIYPGTYTENITTKTGGMTTLVGVGTMGSVVIEADTGTVLTVPSAMMSMAFIKNLKLKSTATGNNSSKLFYGEGTMTTFNDVSFDYDISNGHTEEIIDLEAGSYVFSSCRFDYDSTGTNGGENNFISADGSVAFQIMQGFGTMSTVATSSSEHLHFINDESIGTNIIRDFDITIEATSSSYAGHLDFIHSTNSENIESIGNKITITTPSGTAGSYGQAYHLLGTGGGHIHSTSNRLTIEGFGDDYIGSIGATESLISHFDDIVAEDGIIGAGTYSYVNSPSDGDLQMSGNIIKKLLNITADYDETESWEFGILSANSSTDITATLNMTYFAEAPSGATKTFINAGSTHNFILDPNGATWGGSTLPRVLYPGGYIILERIGNEGVIISSHNTSFNIDIASIDNPSFHVDFSDASSVTTDGSDHITQVVDSVNSWNGTPSSATGVSYGTTTQNGLNTALWDTNNTPLSFGDNDINNNSAGRGMTIIAVVKANNSNDAIMSKYFDATPQREWRFYSSNITIYSNLDASGSEGVVNYSSNYGEWEILQMEWIPGGKTKAYKNGYLLGTSSYDVATIPAGTANLLLGASDLTGADYAGEIGEVWAFSDTITADERDSITSKLGAKWDIDTATPSSSDSSPFGRNSDTDTIKPLIDNDNLDIGTGTLSAGRIESDNEIISLSGTGVFGNRHFTLAAEDGDKRFVFGLLGEETGSNAGASLSLFSYNDTGGYLGTPLVIDRSSGNVGIGVSAPDTKIDVDGAITFRELSADPSTADEGATQIWQSDGTGTGDDGDIYLSTTAGGTNKDIQLTDFSEGKIKVEVSLETLTKEFTAGESLSAGDSVYNTFTVGTEEGQYIIYRNEADGNKLYRKNADDTNAGSAINAYETLYSEYSPDGTKIMYIRYNNPYSYLYIKNADDTANGTYTLGSTIDQARFSPDGNYIYYIDSNKLYKKNADDTNAGSAITTSAVSVREFAVSPDGEFIVYTNISDGNKLYKKNEDDSLNGSAITSTLAYYPTYSPDGDYIVYSNSSGNLAIKNADDTSNGSAITSVSSYYPTYSPDGDYIVYKNGSDSNKLYKKNADDTANGSAITSVSSNYPAYSLNDSTSSSNKLYKTDADDTDKLGFIGFANKTCSADATCEINTTGIDNNQSSLTAGSIYYLSDTAGEISTSKGTYAVQAGYSIADDEILIRYDDREENYTEKTATYTITLFDDIINCTANTFTATLPTAVGTGKIYTIKNTGAGTITLDGDGSETIDGSTTQSLSQWDTVKVKSDGSNWIIL